MLNQTKHKVVLIEILKDIYSDPGLRTVLGFKGGSAAMLFYDLPRLSVDLDFDLLQENKKKIVLEKIKAILGRHGSVREAVEKHYTLFFLTSYEKEKRTIKVEISKRKSSNRYEPKNYLGIPMLVLKQEDMNAGKLSALLTRRRFAMRDVYDIWFFLKNKWPINKAIIKEKTGLPLDKAIEKTIKKVSGLSKNQLLHGLGDLLDTKQKTWVKEKLIDETVFYLRLYQETHP